MFYDSPLIPFINLLESCIPSYKNKYHTALLADILAFLCVCHIALS